MFWIMMKIIRPGNINVHHNSLEIIKGLIKKFEWDVELITKSNFLYLYIHLLILSDFSDINTLNISSKHEKIKQYISLTF